MQAYATTFSYHRRLSPLLGVLLGLALVEAMVLHLIVMTLWGWRVAVPVGLADGILVVLLVWFLVSLRRRPIMLVDAMVTLRTGGRLRLDVPLQTIARFRDGWTADDLKQRDLLNMALIAWPTVVFDLDPPMRGRRRTFRAVAHCVDDPDRFREAVMRAKATQPPA